MAYNERNIRSCSIQYSYNIIFYGCNEPPNFWKLDIANIDRGVIENSSSNLNEEIELIEIKFYDACKSSNPILNKFMCTQNVERRVLQAF